jgi:hypothetical protein
MRTLNEMLKLADEMIDNNNTYGLRSLCQNYEEHLLKIFKTSHFVPDENSDTPNLWKKNLDYANYEDSPWRGNMADFMKKFPGGLRDWIEHRAKEKGKRFNLYSIRDFNKKSGQDIITMLKNSLMKTADKYDPKKWGGVRTFLSQYADDLDQAASDAVEDIVKYYELMRKARKK